MFHSLEEILAESGRTHLPFWKTVQLDDCREEALDEAASFARMTEIWDAMKASDEVMPLEAIKVSSPKY